MVVYIINVLLAFIFYSCEIFLLRLLRSKRLKGSPAIIRNDKYLISAFHRDRRRIDDN